VSHILKFYHDGTDSQNELERRAMPDVTLKLTVGAFSVEVTGPQEYAEKKLQELIAQYLSPARPSASEARAAPVALETGGKKLAAAEFLRRVAVKNQPDRALALAFYLENVERMASFTTGELADKGREAKYPFGNISDVVGKLAARGLVMSAGEKDGQRAYALTASGEQYVESMVEAATQT